jgi:acyl-CoA dehydrogenase
MADHAFLDLPFFDDEQRSLATRLKVWIADNRDLLDQHPQDEAAVDDHCRQLVSRLGEAGFLKLCAPQGYGGDGDVSVRNLCLSRQTLSYQSGLADFAFAMQGLGSAPISIFGDDDLKKRYLPDVAAGKAIAAFAISEPEAGSDVGAITTTAVKDGNRFVLNGTKTWISNAGLADHYVVFARTGDAPGTRGLSAFVVDAETPGLTVSERIAVSAPHPLGTLRFEDCRVGRHNIVAGPGDGFRVGMGTLDMFRSTVGAAALGFARRAFDEAVLRSKTREAFGKKLSDFQITQSRIADMALSIDASTLLIYRAAWAKDNSPDKRITREAAMAKLYATEEAQKVVDHAVQIFGGLGVVRGSVVEELYREVRALRIYEGTSEIQKLVIAADVMKGFDDVD